jgi:hypothetical protein
MVPAPAGLGKQKTTYAWDAADHRTNLNNLLGGSRPEQGASCCPWAQPLVTMEVPIEGTHPRHPRALAAAPPDFDPSDLPHPNGSTKFEDAYLFVS